MAIDTTPFQLLFGANAPKIGVLEVDVLVSEQHERQSTVSDYPVESGLNITDHILKHPESLTLEIFISDTPLPLPRNFSRMADLGNRMQHVDAFLELQRMWEEGELIHVITGLVDYDNMVIESISVPRDAGTGQALRATVRFKKIRTVQSKVGVIPQTVKADVKKSAAPTVNAGNQPTTKVKEPSGNKTVAHALGSAIKSIIKGK